MNVSAAPRAAFILSFELPLFLSISHFILPDRSTTSTASIGSGCSLYPSPFSRMVTSTVPFTATVSGETEVSTER